MSQPRLGASVLKTFEVARVGEVRISAPVASICPFDLEVDRSTLTITYRPDRRCIELASLAAYLDGFAGQEITHEELVVRVRDEVLHALDPRLWSLRPGVSPIWVVVEDTFTYHQMTLVVRTGERP